VGQGREYDTPAVHESPMLACVSRKSCRRCGGPLTGSICLAIGPIHTAVDHKDLDHVVPAVGSGLPVSLDPNGAASSGRTSTAASAAAHPRRKDAIRALKKCAFAKSCHRPRNQTLTTVPLCQLWISNAPNCCACQQRLHLSSASSS